MAAERLLTLMSEEIIIFLLNSNIRTIIRRKIRDYVVTQQRPDIK